MAGERDTARVQAFLSWKGAMGIRFTALVLAAALVGLRITPCIAADAQEGERLARQWCVSCHFVGGEPPAQTAQPGPPPFKDIAGRLNSAEMRAFLTHPHGGMPDLALSRSEIEDLIAYISKTR